MQCPSSQFTPKAGVYTILYLMRGGLTVQDEKKPFFYDSVLGSHGGEGGNVVYVSGRATWLPRNKWTIPDPTAESSFPPDDE